MAEIDPEYDERQFEITEAGHAMLAEIKDLWYNGASIDEIAAYFKMDAGMIDAMLAVDNLIKYRNERDSNG